MAPNTRGASAISTRPEEPPAIPLQHDPSRTEEEEEAGGEDAADMERYRELQARVKRRRIAREIRAMEDELEGRVPDVDVEIEGTALPVRRRKRRASDESDEERFLRSIKPDSTATFAGKSTKELQQFDAAWRNVFRGRMHYPPAVWDARVRIAGQRLRAKAAFEWSRDTKVYYSWEEFISFLRDSISDPRVRMAESLQQLARKEQGDRQKVSDLLQETLELLDDVPERSHEEWRAWTFLLMLRPTLRGRVLADHKEITSIDQVSVTAQRHEQTLQLEEKAERARTRIAATPYAPHAGSSASKRARIDKREEKATNTGSLEARSFSEIVCHNCGKKGHKSTTCSEPRRSHARESQEKRDKSKK